MLDFGNQVAVKVCGITNPEDALTCAAAGVEMVGLNFSPQSSRCLSPTSGTEIIAAVRRRFPPIKFIGVFVDQELEHVQKIGTELALDAVQLHGEESTDYARNLGGTFVIKALRVRSGFSAATAAAYPCDAILLDSWSADAPGGTGQTFPWSVAGTLRPLVRRLILAGGLTSENVADAIRTVQPFAVDVCSGVEDAPGRKNHDKLRSFVATVRAAEAVKTNP